MSGTSLTDSLVGYSACLVSCVAFGTMFAPLRKSDCRDGMFVQWVQCSVVLLFGFVINGVRDFPQFEPIAAAGGALYATGNVFSVPLVDKIGIGLGMLIWGSIQVLVGWSVARFGLFGWLAPTPVLHNTLNYAGFALNLVCGVLFVFVKNGDDNSEGDAGRKSEETEEERKTSSRSDSLELEEPRQPKRALTTRQKIPFLLMACCLGVLHGLMMCPVDILKQKKPSEDSYKVLDYVFSYFVTVFFFSTVYFIVYCAIRKEKAHVDRCLVLPSVFYGCLWCTGITLWFISNDKLQPTVAYPITTRLPAIIGALTDVFIYKTIKGRRNLLFLGFVILLGICAVMMIALSNQEF